MESKLSYLDDKGRLNAYEAITKGCVHLWSKNKLMDGTVCPHCGQKEPKKFKDGKQCEKHETPDRLTPLLETFGVLAKEDPLFLAHFTSYAIKKLDSKDLKVVATFMSSLSDADGTPFSLGSEYKKPNWRTVSQAALCELEPKLALRVLELARAKRVINPHFKLGEHFSKHLRSAAKKYLRYRESNKAIEGAKRTGQGQLFRSLYRFARTTPSSRAVEILRWKQQPTRPGANVKIETEGLSFKGLNDIQIAEKIRAEKVGAQAAIGALPDKLSPVVAAAILEQCSGNQAVIFTEMFESQGLLANNDVKKVWQDKVKTANTSLDRVAIVEKKRSEEYAQVLKEARAGARKDAVGDVGKVYVHIDISGSMSQAIEVAKERGSIIAECVKDPEKNFFWGTFNGNGYKLEKPKAFVKDAFRAALYNVRASGSTNCLACYLDARNEGCDTDIYLTDGDHTDGNIQSMITMFRSRGIPDPRQVVIVHMGNMRKTLENEFKALGIPVAVLTPEQLNESALIAQAIRSAVLGTPRVLEDIMAQPLLELPKWWALV